MGLQKQGMNVWTDPAASEQEPVASCCECDNELFVSITGEESLHQLGYYHVLGNDSTTLSYLFLLNVGYTVLRSY
jgi:hypothetical protein